MDTPFILMVVLSVMALLIPVLSLAFRGIAKKNLSGYLALIVLLASIGIVIYSSIIPSPQESVLAAQLFRSDLLASFFSVAVLLVSILVVVASFDYMKGDVNIPIYYSLLLFTALGMVLLAFSIDLLMIIIAWELMSLPTYILTGFRKKDPFSNEAAIKYFMLGAFSTGIILYAVSITYGLSGSTNLYQVANVLGELSKTLNPLALLSITLFIAGFGLKMSVVPFHMWIPDAYEGAPTTVSALLSAGTKKAGFVAAIRVFLVALPFFSLNWTMAFAALAVLTMTLGNVAALTQRVFSRMLAYSSIAQAGYILIGLAVATPLGLIGTLFHVLNHAVMQSAAFIAAAAVVYGTTKISLDGYNGLWRKMPVTSFALAVSLLALAGVPPLNGFWSKLVLFAAAIDGGLAWLAVAGVLNSALSLGYYAWVIKRMYIDESEVSTRISEPASFTTVLIAATIIIIATGIYPAPIYEFAQNAVQGLFSISHA